MGSSEIVAELDREFLMDRMPLFTSDAAYTSCPPKNDCPPKNSCSPKPKKCDTKNIFNDTITGLCDKTSNPYADVFRNTVNRIDETAGLLNDALRAFVDSLKDELVENLENLRIDPTDSYYTAIATRLSQDSDLTDAQIEDVIAKLKEAEECC